MNKIIEKKLELETLEVAIDALQCRKEWILKEIELYGEKTEDCITDYDIKKYEQNMVILEKYNDLILKLEGMI